MMTMTITSILLVASFTSTAVEVMTNIEDVEEYDYTTGYPQKLVFDN